MSSFSNPHFMYLFDMKNGKQKLGYGESPEDALEILSIRLSQDELDEIIDGQFIKISQRDLQNMWTTSARVFWQRDRLGATELEILNAMAHGGTLKAHRTLDGDKEYRLHPLTGGTMQPDASSVDRLKRRGLIESNKKFPAATYLLTEAGARTVADLHPSQRMPLIAHNLGHSRPK
ncbi:MAG: hypothetical protein HC802_05075 [Caldilineaceae bacterium]|nr:hypothetical protein [Caldilineaceae bacterium]